VLFIQASLSMGGVETFYVRMAKERHRCGQKTKILLISPRSRSNPELLAEAEKYAEIYFLSEISLLSPKIARLIPYHLSLLIPLAKQSVHEILNGVDYVHASGGFGAYLAFRMIQMASLELPITIGLYHSLEFSWGGTNLPFYEQKNREMFFKILPKRNIIFFNENMIDVYGKDFSGVNLFPLGIVDVNYDRNGKEQTSKSRLLIGSVGRLVEFKSYNLWMLDVVKALKDAGIEVSYQVYGEGPLKEQMQSGIIDLGISEQVHLKGKLNYSDFGAVVGGFDVFVGSGTAIVEAASLGVPSIIGIENEKFPLTYGFLSEIPGFSYNENGLYGKRPVKDVIMDFLALDSDERISLSHDHLKKAEIFSIRACNKNFTSISPLCISNEENIYSIPFGLMYSCSFLFYSLSLRLRKDSLNRVSRS
jgi:glycosyltransferase involved in cell wall biosynthesis